jgi:hypothetical protein
MRQIENPERYVKGAMSSHASLRAQGRVPGQEARAARWDCSTPERTPKALRGTSEMELTRLSVRDDERPRIVFPDGRPGWGLSPKQERENRAMEAAARERNRQHAENCQARHAANLKRWNSPASEQRTGITASMCYPY